MLQTPAVPCFGGLWPLEVLRSCRRISQMAPLLLCHSHDNSPCAVCSHNWTFTENSRFPLSYPPAKSTIYPSPPLLQNRIMKINELTARQFVTGNFFYSYQTSVWQWNAISKECCTAFWDMNTVVTLSFLSICLSNHISHISNSHQCCSTDQTMSLDMEDCSFIYTAWLLQPSNNAILS